MSINEIHFLREVLVKDYRGKLTPTMESSYDNAAALHPNFKEVAFYDHAEVSKLYRELGGGRGEGAQMGSMVVIPNRSRWASLWRITGAEVQVISNPVTAEISADEKTARREKARAGNRLLRD